MKLIYEMKKERYEEIISKSLNNVIESSKRIDRSNAYKSFSLVSIPMFIMLLALKYILTGFNLQSKDVVQIILCIVLFYLYFEILLKIIPRMLKKLLRNRLESMFSQKLANIPEIIKVTLEIDNKRIRYHRNNYIEEIIYGAIDEIKIIDDFIQIQYIKDSIIYIPREAFKEIDDFNECYKILKENKDSAVKTILTMDNPDLSFSKTEEDIINYNKYIDSTEAGKVILSILNEYLIKFTIIIMIFIMIVIICMVGFYGGLVVIVATLISIIILKKRNTMKKQVLKNQIKLFKESKCKENKYVKVNEKEIEFSRDEYRYIIKYKGINNIKEENNLILLLKDDSLIEYIPCRIFSNIGDKEKFISLLKRKLN